MYEMASHETPEAPARLMTCHSPAKHNHHPPQNICNPVETNGDSGWRARSVYSEPAAQATEASSAEPTPSQLKEETVDEDQEANRRPVPQTQE